MGVLKKMFLLFSVVYTMIAYSKSQPISALIKKSNQDISETVDQLTTIVTKLSREGQERENKIANLVKENGILQAEVDTLNEKLSNGLVHESAAFTAAMLAGHYHLRDGSAVPFGLVRTNQGNHYDNQRNCYTCPYNGIYSFSFSVHSGPLNLDTYATTVTEIVVGKSTVATAFCASILDDYDLYFQCSQSVAVECQKGEEVWIKSRGSSPQLAGDSEGLSTFTGFLINKI